jgi:GNAT superfamily N-acetyltransferase
MHKAAVCFGLFDDERIVGFCAVMHFPHPTAKNIRRVHRLVILPDYQGIGLGVRFLEAVAEHHVERGFRFSIVTSARNLCCALARSPRWKAARYSVAKSPPSVVWPTKHRTNCKTGSFYYRKGETK